MRGETLPQVSVIGLGYIGLPTAAIIARAGMRVHGLDLSYFTGKLQAYLRYCELPFTFVDMDTAGLRRAAATGDQFTLPQGIVFRTPSAAAFARRARRCSISACPPATRAACGWAG